MDAVDDRADVHSTVIASRQPISAWHHLIADLSIADTVLERLMHRSMRIDLTGESTHTSEVVRRRCVTVSLSMPEHAAQSGTFQEAPDGLFPGMDDGPGVSSAASACERRDDLERGASGPSSNASTALLSMTAWSASGYGSLA